MEENLLEKDRCTRGLTTRLVGNVINFYDEVVSTNDIAKDMARGGAKEGTVVMARSQSGGKGRNGRTFSSPPGGIYLSVILRPSFTADMIAPLPLIMGLSISKAIQCNVFKVASLKWPNDILVDGRKVAGILTTSSVKGRKAEYVIVGMGINLNTEPGDLPVDVRKIAGSLKNIKGGYIDPNEFTRDLLYFIDMHYSMFIEGQRESLMDQWVDRSSTMGSEVEISTRSGAVKGKVIGIDESGALILQKDSKMVRVDSGDCLSLVPA